MNEDLKILLLKDFEYFSEQIKLTEERGENRLTFHNTLATAVIGAIIVINKDTFLKGCPISKQLVVISTLALGTLLVVGIIVFKRLKKRNTTTDSLISHLQKIRRLLLKICDSNGKSNDIEYPFLPKRSRSSFTSLSDIVAIFNLATIALMSIIVLYSIGIDYYFELAIVGTVISVSAWFFFRNKKNNLSSVEGDLCKKISRAGGVVYKKSNGAIEYLIIRPLDKTEVEWVFPKGHLELGEIPHDAAKREVLEETGIEADILFSLGITNPYDIPGEKQIQVEYFLMRFIKKSEKHEDRKLEWVSYEDALKKIKHEEIRLILEKARTFLESV